MKWISVKDRKPEHDHVVLVGNNRYASHTTYKAVYYKDYDVFVSSEAICCIHDRYPLDVTHWMPYPADLLPKKEEDGRANS